MKKKLLLLLFISQYALCQTPCVSGFAGQYPCKGYDFLSNIPVSTLAGANGNFNSNDIWGWTDSLTNKEYAIVAMSNSTAFVDISDPINPVFLGRLNTSAGTNVWRDVKVYNNHAFIVADNVGNHGMQVFDLTRLREATSPQNFTSDAVYTGVGSCHNIFINENTGIAYLVGCRGTNNGGPIFLDISNPTSPKLLGNYIGDGYSHDAQVITYSGPDTTYTGKEIYVGSNENEIVILDVTNKQSVIRISKTSYNQIGYTHQGWFTEDHRFFIVGDEIDEQTFGMNTRTLVFDLSDLNNPELSYTYFGNSSAIDHNGYVKGNRFFMASYRAGMRVLDITNIASTTNAMTEIGFFDTYPNNDATAFNGAWSVYPYFSSGNIIISDIERGLFIVRKSGTLSTISSQNLGSFSVFPNPTKDTATIQLSDNLNINNITLYSILGQKVFEKSNINQNKYVLETKDLTNGIYFVKINNLKIQKFVVQ